MLILETMFENARLKLETQTKEQEMKQDIIEKVYLVNAGALVLFCAVLLIHAI